MIIPRNRINTFIQNDTERGWHQSLSYLSQKQKEKRK